MSSKCTSYWWVSNGSWMYMLRDILSILTNAWIRMIRLKKKLIWEIYRTPILVRWVHEQIGQHKWSRIVVTGMEEKRWRNFLTVMDFFVYGLWHLFYTGRQEWYFLLSDLPLTGDRGSIAEKNGHRNKLMDILYQNDFISGNGCTAYAISDCNFYAGRLALLG